MGVKSLWTLLTPVGRPIALDTMEGKTVAIDSSIWLYQFQATMRTQDGEALSNAHVLGFLRRICKLLFYGMKPVFVFDGGAPVLKRSTLNERRKRKSGAAASHTKIAERLLAAQMRREALKQAQGQGGSRTSKGKNKAVVLGDDTVYYEDLDPSMPKTPAKKQNAPERTSSEKKSKFHDHDPYRLPDVNMEERVMNATRRAAPDPRLATEEELRDFIEDMRPEDFDVTSPAFRELPTEVQYEIVGDLRLKSRQTSYTRLQQMLESAPTALDFSKQQIKNLKQRNTLTQQLLTTTDSIGKAHISIPIRIASECNREYVLIKNEGESGGWILGIRDDGTQNKPIILDHEELVHGNIEEDSDDMEEVPIPTDSLVDSDLRMHHREMALSAIALRHGPKKTTTKTIQKRRPTPLFDLDDEPGAAIEEDIQDYDSELAFAIQASLDHSNSTHVAQNVVSETQHTTTSTESPSREIGSKISVSWETQIFPGTSHLGTALSIGNASPLKNPLWPGSGPSAFGKPHLLVNRKDDRPASPELELEYLDDPPVDQSDEDNSQLLTLTSHHSLETTALDVKSDTEDDMEEVVLEEPVVDLRDPPVSPAKLRDMESTPTNPLAPMDDISGEHRDWTEQNDLDSNWSRPSSPIGAPSHSEKSDRPSSPHETWDAAQEMDPDVEEGEFARFMSQVKGRDLDVVRREIDDEIVALNEKKKTALRGSEDISQQMIAQIMMMLRLFGIPYITAPMEAEAQCAELVSLGLVDGIITDDSDVFLFGGERVFKNMFNQSKTVECFLLSDLSRELGLDRDTLIRLAYLLGSDYVDGIPGVGPVVAMELLEEFPGEDGLHKFKDWWLKVQIGKDKEEETRSSFRKRFKKKFKDLFLSNDWPPAAVRDAYYYPTVDSSDEPFKWGLPDLDALRGFLQEELAWDQPKVDDLLLPIIQKIRKRQAGGANKQGNLNDFLDINAGSGTRAPRKEQVYSSKRLQQVVSDFRKKRKAETSSIHSSGDSDTALSEDERPAVKKGKTGPATVRGKQARSTRGKAQASGGAPRGRDKKKSSKRNKPVSDSDDIFIGDNYTPNDAPQRRIQLRPRAKPAYRGAVIESLEPPAQN